MFGKEFFSFSSFIINPYSRSTDHITKKNIHEIIATNQISIVSFTILQFHQLSRKHQFESLLLANNLPSGGKLLFGEVSMVAKRKPTLHSVKSLSLVTTYHLKIRKRELIIIQYIYHRNQRMVYQLSNPVINCSCMTWNKTSVAQLEYKSCAIHQEANDFFSFSFSKMMGNNNTTTTTLYRRKIDAQGNYLPFPGYTIVSHALHPLPKPLIDLVTSLSTSELKNYYSFLPSQSYHVTINPIENVSDAHKSLLHEEQRRISAVDTRSVCTVDRLIRKKVIFIDVQFPAEQNPNFEHLLQTVRSPALQQANVLHQYVLPWHLTLAYQYKTFENPDIERQLDQIIANCLQSSTSSFSIPLDHIRICHYDDMTKFTPI